MKQSIPVLLLLILIFSAVTALCAPLRYVGVKKCKKCHNTKSEGIYTSWKNSRHSMAYQSLKSSSAHKKVKESGLTGKPWRLPECLVCHSVDPPSQKVGFTKQFKIEDGVQCESCHGPGSLYATKKIMRKISMENKLGESETAIKTGLVGISKKSCGTRCHKSEIEYKGVIFRNPCYSKLKNIKTIMKDLINPFH